MSPDQRSGVSVDGRVLARNTILNLVGQAAPLVAALIAIPIVVRGLGTARFGILSLVWVVLTYFSVFDLGFGRAATKLIGEALGRGERARVPRIVWTAALCQLALGIAGAVCFAGFSSLFVSRVLRVPLELLGEARIAFLLLAIAVPLVLLAGTFRGLLEALQRFDFVNLVRGPFMALMFLGPLAGVWLGWDLQRIVVLLIAAQSLAAFAYWQFAKKAFSGLSVSPRIDRDELGRLAWFGGWVAISSVVSPLLVYMERFAIGIVLSVSAVAYYAAPHEIASRVLILPASLVATLFPAFATLHSQGDRARLELMAAQSIKYVVLTVGPLVAAITVNASLILQIWLGADFVQQSTPVLQLIAVGVLINAVGLIPHSLVQAIGRPDLTAKFHLAELALQTVVVIALIRAMGISGAALAWTLRLALDASLQFAACHRLGVMSGRQLTSSKVPHAMGLLAATTVLLLLATSLQGTALRVGTMMAVLVLTGFWAWRYLLDPMERRHLWGSLGVVPRDELP